MVTIKKPSKPVEAAVDYEALYKAEKAKRESLEQEAATKAVRQTRVKKASTFTVEDVLSFEAGSKNYEGEANTWFDLKEQFIERNTDGSPKLMLSKRGSDRVVIKAGLDYGVYRYIKGIAYQMNGKNFSGLSEGEGGQIEALRNILQYCADHDLIETPEVEAPVVEKKAKAAKK